MSYNKEKISEILKNRFIQMNYSITKDSFASAMIDNNLAVGDEGHEIMKSIIVDEMINKYNDTFTKFVNSKEDDENIKFEAQIAVMSWKELYELLYVAVTLEKKDKKEMENKLRKTLNHF